MGRRFARFTPPMSPDTGPETPVSVAEGGAGRVAREPVCAVSGRFGDLCDFFHAVRVCPASITQSRS
jgi:hypothetical protein